MKLYKTKRLFLTFLASILMILSSAEVDAQYKVNKEIYDSHEYTSEMGGHTILGLQE
ncbi:MAG: hypothetical protein PF450_02235 [Bacteroidales bacterium]|jgi:hypothetical protein|nr:hypothetical protein [Bacteroidales bacterium]